MAFKPIAHNFTSKWRSEDVKIQESADFSSLLLSKKVLAGLKNAGYQSPSPIQIEAIPVGRFGKDLVVQAKSGTGKTLVFSIVTLEMILPDLRQPQVLIIAPTREIAHQICSVIEAVGCEFDNLNCCTFIGGTLVSEDKENAIGCQIAVGTPGRIKHLITEGILKTNCIRLFVLDEADQLLEASFLSDVDEIFLTLPKDKQVIATSATYPEKLKVLADRYFRNPFLARLNIDELALLGIVHYVKIIDVPDLPILIYQKKLECLEKVLTSISFSQCLVFCNQLSRVPMLSSDIKDWGFTTTSISSNKEQADRLKAIDRLKLFKCKVLVSSDLTSRGIDAENVNLVVNFDLPYTKETYLHRVGRAGRYGSRGLAVTLLLQKESEKFETLKNTAKFPSYNLPDPIPQNLMNIRPQGFQGCEEGFETEPEKLEINVNGDLNLEQEEKKGNIDASSDTNCIQTECEETDSNQVQDLPSIEMKCSDGVGLDVCHGKYILTNGKEKISGSVESDGQQQNEQNLENRKIDSVIDSNEVLKSEVESENSSVPKSDVEKTPGLANNCSAGVESDNNSEFHNGIASFLTQMQITDNSTDKTPVSQSDNQTKESLEGFYYQVFKAYAEENIPDLVTEVQTKDTTLSATEPVAESMHNGNDLPNCMELSESQKEPAEKASFKGNSEKPNVEDSSDTDTTDSDLEFLYHRAEMEKKFGVSMDSSSDGSPEYTPPVFGPNLVSFIKEVCERDNFEIIEPDEHQLNVPNDENVTLSFKDSTEFESENVSTPKNKNLLTNEDVKNNSGLVETDGHEPSDKNGKIEPDSVSKNYVGETPILLNNCSSSVDSDDSSIKRYFNKNSNPKAKCINSSQNTSSSSSSRYSPKTQNKTKPRHSSSSKVQKYSKKVDKPIHQGKNNSQLEYTDVSDNQKFASHTQIDELVNPVQSYNRHDGHFTRKENRPKCNPHKYPPHGPVQNNSQTSHVCNGMIQSDFNTISRSCQEVFNTGYNFSRSNSCIRSSNCCGSHHSCSISNYSRNHCHSSGNNSGNSSSNIWYDTFSKQWQHIHNLCYFH